MGLFQASTTTLIRQLSEYSGNDRKLCEVIGKLGDKADAAAAPHLIQLLKRDRYVSDPPPPPPWLTERYPYVNQRAAIALAQIGTKECVDALVGWARARGGGSSGLAELLLKRLGVSDAEVREATTDWRRMWTIDSEGDIRHQVPPECPTGRYFHIEFVIDHDKDGYLYFSRCRVLDASSATVVTHLNERQQEKVAKLLDGSHDWQYHWRRSPASVRQVFGRY